MNHFHNIEAVFFERQPLVFEEKKAENFGG